MVTISPPLHLEGRAFYITVVMLVCYEFGDEVVFEGLGDADLVELANH